MNNFNSIHVIDTSYSIADQLDSFADTNTLLELCESTQEAYLHFWTTKSQTMILGINDRHVPNLQSGLQYLHQQNVSYFLRNSGGLAVISDPGVLNISLFLPTKNTPLSVDEAFTKIADLMKMAVPNFKIDTFEIEHSYCPGKFDLSINGQKIAGIAQRRNQDALVLMLYLSVTGDQDRRSEIVSQFYQQSDAYSQTKWHFPTVIPETMTTLSNLDNSFTGLETVKQRLYDVLSSQSISVTDDTDITLTSTDYHQELIKQRRKMELRNEQIPRF
ncbi:lipoate--protein ligase [Lentilactobacillus sp. Marseille-Q4993]|uniref:lipoyl protein ligase domain-containing protein n=1 Tax=Lentilactobacillus sp. Marseille-Q4993 TaxID=3039492 RepID=UPI0024BC498B|nr:lipoate--protein ligase [Lentilactobacillus sp. Marseille-Q4993]